MLGKKGAVLSFCMPWLQRHAAGGLFFLSVLLGCLGLLYVTMSWMWDEERLPLSHLIVQGELDHVTPSDVQHAFANLDHIGTFMSQDIDELQYSLQALPWVARASVRKQWPDTVKVFLTEYKAQAIWNADSVLDEQGVIFYGDLGLSQQEYVKLYGPDDRAEQVLAVWKRYHNHFEQIENPIASLLLNDRQAWQMILNNGIRLELGKESLNERVERFFLLYKQLGDQIHRVSYIDLRYDTGAAVGWLPKQEQQQEKKDDEIS